MVENNGHDTIVNILFSCNLRLPQICNERFLAMCKGRKSSWSECKGRTKSKSRRLRLRSNDKRSRTRDDKKCRNGKQGLSKKCKNRLKQPKGMLHVCIILL